MGLCQRRLSAEDFMNRNAEAALQDANHLLATKTGSKYLKEPAESWGKVSWTDEANINLYQSDAKKKVWRQ